MVKSGFHSQGGKAAIDNI